MVRPLVNNDFKKIVTPPKKIYIIITRNVLERSYLTIFGAIKAYSSPHSLGKIMKILFIWIPFLLFSPSSCKQTGVNDIESSVKKAGGASPDIAPLSFQDFNTFTYWQKCIEHLGSVPKVNYFDSIAVQMPQTDPLKVNHPNTQYLQWMDNLPRGSTRRQFCDKPVGVVRAGEENLACLPGNRAGVSYLAKYLFD